MKSKNSINKRIKIFVSGLLIALQLAMPFSYGSALAVSVQPSAPTAPSSPARVGSTTKTEENSAASAANDSAESKDTSTDPGLVTSEAAAPTQVEATPAVIEATNGNTGVGSTNSAQLGPIGGTAAVSNANQADATNDVNLSASSGDNASSYNTGNGEVTTGDANLVLNILNMINSNFITMPDGKIVFLFKNIYGDLNGDYIIDPNTGETYNLEGARITLANTNTGANSDNSASVTADGSVDIANNNSADTNNNINLNADSGNNTAGYNTGNGSVKTGDANVSLNLMNLVNTTFMATDFGLVGVINIFGNWLGDLLLPKFMSGSGNNGTSGTSLINSDTGANSTNDATANINNSLDVNNDNIADLNNTVSTSSQTGQNQSGYNTGNGSVNSGNSDTSLNLHNIANQNFLGDFSFIGFINVMGKWVGTNLFAPMQQAFGGNGNPNVAIQNQNTGSGSTNQANLDTNASETINNTNDGTLNNNVNIVTNTGANSASYNTGNGSVQSGDTNIMANIMNIMNVNVISKKFVFLVINVFGDWTGNIDVEGNKPKNVNIATDESTSSKTGNTVVKATTNLGSNGQSLNSSQSQAANTNQESVTTRAAAEGESGIRSIVMARIGSNEATNSFVKFVSSGGNVMLALFAIVYLSFLVVYTARKRARKIR